MVCKKGKRENKKCKNKLFPCYDNRDKQCYSLDGTLLLDPVGDIVDTSLDVYNRAFDFIFTLLGGKVPAEDSDRRATVLERDNARLRSYGPFRPLGNQGMPSDGMEAIVRASENPPYLGTMAPSIVPYLNTVEEEIVPPPVGRLRQRSQGRGARHKRKKYKKRTRREQRVRLKPPRRASRRNVTHSSHRKS
tara:strand:- start:169 stop:741 length:573 start_codon:yes stop_codon:yes gene_type:complete